MKKHRTPVVLDFSKLLPGPFATMVLADLGLRVIRVELPHWPDMLREIGPKIKGQGFCYWMANRNKESLCLDFRKPEGRKALLRMIGQADVVVEGFRPGLMDRLGLGAKELRRRFPRLVYVSITGYGHEGPLADSAGHDLNFQALSGFLGGGDSNGAFSFPSVQLADLAGSLYAAAGALGALRRRDMDGKGAHVRISLLDSIFSWQVLSLGQYLGSGKKALPGGDWWSGSLPFYRLYETRDGRHMAVAAVERQFAVDLLTRLGRPDLLERMPRDEADPANPVLIRELESAFRTKTLKEWTAVFAGKDVCVTPVLTPLEALEHPQLKGRGAILRSGPAAPSLASPLRTDGAPPRPRRAPPALGKDNASVLRSFGFTGKEIRSLKTAGLLRRSGAGRGGLKPSFG